MVEGHSKPAGHSVQLAAPPVANVPLVHAMTVAAVVDGQYEPAGQGVQATAPPTLYEPCAQGAGTAVVVLAQ